jgi:hypothetical protein
MTGEEATSDCLGVIGVADYVLVEPSVLLFALEGMTFIFQLRDFLFLPH